MTAYALLGLAACSSQPSASAAHLSPACSAILTAIGPYAAADFSPDKAGNWANDVAGAANKGLNILSEEQASSLTDASSAQHKLQSDENTLLNDATGLENDAFDYNNPGNGANPANVPSDISSVADGISRIYANCGQAKP